MRNIIVLVGRAATGKDEIERILERENVRRLVSHTSRPKREGEVEGKDYYFCSKEDLEKMIFKDNTAYEYTSYIVDGEEWFYALSKEEVDSVKEGELAVVTVNPHGISQLLDNDELSNRLFVIKVVSDFEERRRRYLKRGGNTEEVKRQFEQRVVEDDIDFDMYNDILTKRIIGKGIPHLELENKSSLEDLESDTHLVLNIVKRYNKMFPLYSHYVDDKVNNIGFLEFDDVVSNSNHVSSVAYVDLALDTIDELADSFNVTVEEMQKIIINGAVLSASHGVEDVSMLAHWVMRWER